MLTAIVPVSDMAGRLQNLENWLKAIGKLKLNVIIVHDYRDQQTLEELTRITTSVNPGQVHLHSGAFGSPGAARNFGLEQSNTKYVCFWDSDDLPQPKTVYDALGKNLDNFDILVGQFRTLDNSSKIEIKGLSSDYDILDLAIKPGIWRMVFLREFVGNHRFRDMKMGEDQLFIAELVKSNPCFVFTHDLFYEYFVGRNGQLTSKSENKLELIETYTALIKLREGSVDSHFEYISVNLSRLWFSLLKMLKMRKESIRLLRALGAKSYFICKNPQLRLRALLFVISRTFGKKQK